MNDILISIILPVYNGAKYLKETLDSVLAQSFKDFELLIIDDGSTDNSLEIVKKCDDHRIMILSNERNLGLQKTLNRGLREARGEYIARIDSDDTWPDVDKLKKQYEFISANPNYVLVGVGGRLMDEAGNDMGVDIPISYEPGDIRKNMLKRNNFIHSGVLFKRESVLAVGSYSEASETRHVEDYDLWLKLGKVGQAINLPFIGVNYRVVKGLSQRNPIEQCRNIINLVKKYRDDYPGFYLALFKGYWRLWLYGYFNFFKIKLLLKKLLRF